MCSSKQTWPIKGWHHKQQQAQQQAEHRERKQTKQAEAEAAAQLQDSHRQLVT